MILIFNFLIVLMATTGGYEAMYSGNTVLFYVNRDGLPLSDRCNERMWNFCMEQYPQSESDEAFVVSLGNEIFRCNGNSEDT